MILIGPSASSVPANNKVLTVLSATLPLPPRFHCCCKIFARGDISSGLETGSNHWGPGQVITQDACFLKPHLRRAA